MLPNCRVYLTLQTPCNHGLKIRSAHKIISESSAHTHTHTLGKLNAIEQRYYSIDDLLISLSLVVFDVCIRLTGAAALRLYWMCAVCILCQNSNENEKSNVVMANITYRNQWAFNGFPHSRVLPRFGRIRANILLVLRASKCVAPVYIFILFLPQR